MNDLYILQAITGKESSFIAHAQKLLGNRRGEVRFLVPRRRLWIRRRGKRIYSEKPVFPGYVFFECEDPDPVIQQILRKAPGYVRFLRRQEGELRPMSEPDRRLIGHLLQAGEISDFSQVVFDTNNRIKALSGPLKGFEGQIVKVDRRKQRAKVRFLLNDKKFLIDFQYEEIQLVENQQAPS